MPTGALYQCQIVNSTGKPIILKIVGAANDANYTPDLQGVETGVLFAAPPQNTDLHFLREGERMVIVWSADGAKLITFSRIKISSITNIDVKLDGATVTVKAVASDGASANIL